MSEENAAVKAIKRSIEDVLEALELVDGKRNWHKAELAAYDQDLIRYTEELRQMQDVLEAITKAENKAGERAEQFEALVDLKDNSSPTRESQCRDLDDDIPGLESHGTEYLMDCARCDTKQIWCPEVERRDKNGNLQKAIVCPRGHWLQWVPQNIPYEEYKMPFGKHKGKLISDIPADYLIWIIKQKWGTIKGSLREYIERRASEDTRICQAIMRSGNDTRERANAET